MIQLGIVESVKRSRTTAFGCRQYEAICQKDEMKKALTGVERLFGCDRGLIVNAGAWHMVCSWD